MALDNELLKKQLDLGLDKLQLDIIEDQRNILVEYVYLLSKWNKQYNLTAIRNESEMMSYHILDALTVAPYVKDKHNLCDIGTGAGIPGIILAIIYPNQKWTLIDGNGKKIRFLIQAKHELGLSNIAPIHSRAEQYQTADCFDGIISRAVGAIEELIKITDHLLCADGCWYAMKGGSPDAELCNVSHPFKVEQLDVPFLDAERHLVTIKR